MDPVDTPPFALVLDPFAMHDPETAALSERERQVICLISCGLTTVQAAERLGISRKTADTHRGRAVKKIGARTNEDLVRWCLTWGFINLDGTIS